MADIFENCIECSRDCITGQICPDNLVVSLPKNLKVKVIANPAFWGFGSLSENVLISGWASFSNGHYDFFDGFDEFHFAYKTCGGTTTGPLINEQRPDVAYRTVYDPESSSANAAGKIHYNGASTGDSERGGAEVYLVDRDVVSTTDSESCDETDPTTVFKKSPEKYGFGNKILLTDKVYKNITGAWRLTDLNLCYDDVITSTHTLMECDGTPKQNISSLPDYSQLRASGESGCLSDGSTASPYKGEFYATSSLFRDGSSNFVQIKLKYKNSEASYIKDGKHLIFDIAGSGEDYSDVYTIFDVSHSGTYSVAKLVGTFGTDTFSYNVSGKWSMLNSVDPQSCCGGYAYGIDDDNKGKLNDPNYHVDFGRIFNNSKNVLQSNRPISERQDYGISVTQVITDGPRKDTSYPSYESTGIYTQSGYPVFDRKKAYYGPFYEVDKFDNATRRSESQNTIKGRNGTCYSKQATLEVFPDCMVQYKAYTDCDEVDTHTINQVSRLGFVFRGCDFPDKCEFNASGQPIAGWATGAPTGINDLQRGLAGQEIYMFINLSDVRAVELENPPCSCVDALPGQDAPIYYTVPSPITFPSFPKFDLYPEEYGCNEPVFQMEYATECESSGYPSSGCNLPLSAYACDVRQPYTTYGFMRNLCGSSSSDRRSVIVDSFTNLVQAGNYTNTSSVVLNEPMYWNFNNPYTHESGITGFLGPSGDYAFWGVSDTTGRLIAPYFRTVATTRNRKCTGSDNYLNFDLCETRANGWPTDEVPFLIEIDHGDACTTCVTPLMYPSGLVLTLEGLDTTYSHNPGATTKYGYNNCRYKGVAIDPAYYCDSGYGAICSAFSTTLEYNEPYTGNTCSCINTDINLRTFTIKGTDKVLGFSSWGTHNSYVKMPSGCHQGDDNDFLQSNPAQEEIYGFVVYGSFKLACNGMHDYLMPYESGATATWSSLSSPLHSLYAGGGCSLNYPSADSDLDLSVNFAVIASGYERLLELMPESHIPTLSEPTLTPVEMAQIILNSNILGCPSYRIEYGCSGVNNTGFYPCDDCLSPATPSCDCPNVDCNSCSGIIAVNGKPSINLPVEYRGPCGCDCNLQIMRIRDSEGNITSYEPDPACSGTIVAIQGSGSRGTTGIIYTDFGSAGILGYGPTSASATSACSWHTGPNATITGIKNKFSIPERLSQGTVSCDSLDITDCYASACEDPNATRGACGDPIPWTGVAPESGVSLIRRACYPEIMIVDRVECLESGFKLYVAREYHSHPRTWQEIVMEGSPAAPVCKDKQKGAYLGSGCIAIPFATPSDSLTPAYNVNGYNSVCLSHPSSGTLAHQDFLYGPDPVAPGYDTLWNYFNLFYEDGLPNIDYVAAIQLEPEDPCLTGTVYETGTIFGYDAYTTPADRYGIDVTNKKHSCLQDYSECGGDFYCNKMFFPRRSYLEGTKITRFGALQYCKPQSILKVAEWYDGYQDFDSDDEPEILEETRRSRYIDPCDATQYVLLESGISIDATELIVPDYLPLIGLKDTNFRYNANIKSCIVLNESCASDWLPVHSSGSITAGIHTYKTLAVDGETSFGYYLDKTVTSVSSDCLFSPFKIMVDVECCSSNIRTTNYPNSDPTSLEYIIQDVPSWACKGFVKTQGCECESTVCGGIWGYYYHLAPKPVCITFQKARGIYTDVISSGMIDYYESCGGNPGCPPTGTLTQKMGVTVGNSEDSLLAWNPQEIGGIEVEIGGPGLEGIVGCSCDTGTGNLYWGGSTSSPIYKCGSDIMIGEGETIDIPVYECGDYYYLPAQTGPTYDTGGCCSLDQTVCNVLTSCWKIPKDGCAIIKKSTPADYSVDFINCTGCLPAGSYVDCENSVIRATITEG